MKKFPSLLAMLIIALFSISWYIPLENIEKTNLSFPNDNSTIETNSSVQTALENITLVCDRASDSLALVELYLVTDGSNWTYTETDYWNGVINQSIPNAGNLWDFNLPIDTWHGVGLNAEGCIEILALNDNNLSGVLTDLNIPDLETLICYNNNLTGSIPDFFNTPDLTYFICNNNNLVGDIPNFSNLANLTYFYCNANNLTGAIPDFSNLSNLTYFYCNDNSLSGVIPDFSNLPNLQDFNCAFNNLSGEIPDFSIIPNLINFACNDNNLVGVITDFSNLPNLSIFTCQNNQLMGCYPDYICNLSVFNSLNNIALAWEGDHTFFCNSQTQIDAPCNDGDDNNGTNDVILPDCTCGASLSSSVQNTKQIDLKIYPNPAINEVYLQCQEKIHQVELLNVHGKLIITFIGTEIKKINISDVPSGIYFLKCFEKNGLEFKQIIKP